jgi:DNA replication protein DnaC
MLLEATYEKLAGMKLFGMLNALKDRLGRPDHSELSAADLIGFLVDDEYTYRENKRLGRLLHKAKFKERNACIENLDYRSARGLKKAVVLDLARNQWITAHQNILITGTSGSGKSYLAQAFGNNACRQGLSVHYVRLPRLLFGILQSRAEGTYTDFLKRLSRFQLLIIDDLGVASLSEQERQDLLEIVEDRYGASATVVTSQLPVSGWHTYLGGGVVADAILDRLVHNAHRIDLKSVDSNRKTLAAGAAGLTHPGHSEK